MELPIGDWIELARDGIGLVPPTILAMILLGGPTAGWLLYHFVIEPRAARMRVFERAPFWVCTNCRSVNDHRLARCYRCDAEPVEDELELIDAHPTGPSTVAPVGPGLNFGAPATSTQPGSIPILATPSAAAETGQGWDSAAEEWDEQGDEDRAALPDVAAMTEVIDAPYRGRSARKPGPIPVGPGRPAVARPRRVAVAGPARDTDDDPSAA